MKKCPYCGSQIADDCKFCSECGKEYPNGNTCRYCGALIYEGDVYCENCGNIYHTQQCPRCGSKKGRAPKPNDACFLAEVSGLESNI